MNSKGPVRKLLGQRRTIFLDEPLINRLGSTPVAGNTDLQEIKEAKQREWTSRGYSPKLQEKALKLAKQWTDRMSSFVVRVVQEPQLKDKAYRKLYKSALDDVAEHWIKSSKPIS